jgi:hypothetical protein
VQALHGSEGRQQHVHAVQQQPIIPSLIPSLTRMWQTQKSVESAREPCWDRELCWGKPTMRGLVRNFVVARGGAVLTCSHCKRMLAWSMLRYMSPCQCPTTGSKGQRVCSVSGRALQLALLSILCHAGLLMHVVLRSSLI